MHIIPLAVPNFTEMDGMTEVFEIVMGEERAVIILRLVPLQVIPRLLMAASRAVCDAPPKSFGTDLSELVSDPVQPVTAAPERTIVRLTTVLRWV